MAFNFTRSGYEKMSKAIMVHTNRMIWGWWLDLILVIIVTSSSVSVFLVKIMQINDKTSMKISSINTYKI